jgi:transaldolase
MNTAQELFAAGQSIWYDNIQRGLLKNGELAGMIRRGEIRGVTSNPTIFMIAITKSHDYDDSLAPLIEAGLPDEDIFFQLAIEDIQAAADLFLPLYQQSGGGDGFVSLEVSPYLANDTAKTLAQAKQLWQRVDRPNLMIKIPATKAGIPAITAAIAAGVNVNVTLIFSRQRYAEVMDAYLQGLEQRAAAGLPVDTIASVASFFVSRVDTKIDARLQELVQAGGAPAQQAGTLLGKAAIANARLAYADFQQVFTSERFEKLKAHGARVQRPLWASTSTKNPAYRDVIYVEELIGADTVNTVPPQTLTAFLDHGQVRPSLEEDLDGARQALAGLEALGVAMAQVTAELEDEGVRSFSDAFTVLLKAVALRRQTAAAD